MQESIAIPEPNPASTSVNVAKYLDTVADKSPYRHAVIAPSGYDTYGRVAYSHLTFQQLQQESDSVAFGLEEAGITRGVRTILMVRPSLEFFILIFAMFKTGAVPVVVDPGMGIQRMLGCLKESRAQAMIGIPLAHALRVLRPGFFKTVEHKVTVGRRWFWGGHRYSELRNRPWQPYPIVESTEDELAAILFTTGSTGPAKGVEYTHGIFDSQVRMIQARFDITEDDIDLPTFPLFSLFDPALGMMAVIPDMDPVHPAQVDPEKIIQAISDYGITNMFASPALLNRVGSFGKANGVRLPSLKRVISAGAPATPDNIAQFCTMLPEDGLIHTGYGATEAMPVSSFTSAEILSETAHLSKKGFGMCVGTPLEGIDVRIITISDDPQPQWHDDLVVADGDIGEITVVGDIVTRSYFERPEENASAKIQHGDYIRHRMGDLGWRDSKGRIWFCGRKNQRVVTPEKTFFTIPCEAIFNVHPAVFRSALVGVGQPHCRKPVICIELKPDHQKDNKDQLRRELLELGRKNMLTEEIDILLFHPGFPVDIRHNSKIFREKLSVWAEKKVA